MRLQGKSAMITGAARGIGRAFAQAYIDEGAQVAIADIDIARAKETAADLGTSAIAVEMDVTRQDSIDQAVSQTIDAFGQIDILVNNAALFTAAPIVEITREDYQRVFDINVAGALFTLQAVADHMVKRGQGGKIINMASQAWSARRALGRRLLRVQSSDYQSDPIRRAGPDQARNKRQCNRAGRRRWRALGRGRCVFCQV